MEHHIHAHGPKPVLVIGVGNWYRGDDAVGLVVARKLRAMNIPEIVSCEESGEGMALMEAWTAAEHVIIVDASSSGSPPGTVHKLDADEMMIPTAFFRYSSHAFSVAEAIEMARALSCLPPRLTVYGIEGEDFAPGVHLSPEVEQALEKVIKQVIDEAAVVTTT
jgi:hydrogenase maturation protease